LKNKVLNCNQANFKHQCTPVFCSKDEKTCSEFKNFELFTEIKYFQKINKNFTKKFNSFKKRIKSCVLHQYKFKLEDFCLNKQKNCFIKMAFDSIKIGCPCSNKSFEFSCTNDYCTKDLTTCIALKLHRKTTEIKIKKCS
jgi:hypothetical protein